LALTRELMPGESIVWQGEQLARLEPAHFAIYLFAVPWTAFALFWTALAAGGVSTMQGDDDASVIAWAFPLFGVPFIAVGLGMMAMPFKPLWDRGKILFAITDKRAIRLRLGKRLDVSTCPAERIGLVRRIEHSDGTGTLRLAINIGRDSDGDRTTEYFEIGEVADVMNARDAIESLTGEDTEL
jgi:hypothetical protein